MHINLEITDKHTVQSYSDTQVKINFTTYQQNLVVNKDVIVTDWAINTLQNMNHDFLEPLLANTPEVIIIGHQAAGFAPIDIMQYLSQQRIGFECMSIGAACRTYNVLLSEGRNVVLGLIF